MKEIVPAVGISRRIITLSHLQNQASALQSINRRKRPVACTAAPPIEAPGLIATHRSTVSGTYFLYFRRVDL